MLQGAPGSVLSRIRPLAGLALVKVVLERRQLEPVQVLIVHQPRVSATVVPLSHVATRTSCR